MIAPDTRGPASLTGLVAVMVLVAVIAGGVLLTTFSGDPTAGSGGKQDTPATSPASRDARDEDLSESQRALAATRTLIDLEQGVRTAQKDVFDRAFAVAPGSAQAGDDIFTSLARLPLSTYSMRYIGEVSHRADTWVADVAVQWGLRGVDKRAVTNEIEVTFTDESPADGARVVSMEAGNGEQTPIWLLGRLEVQRVGPALVLSLQPPLTEGVVDQTRRAVRDVRRVLTGWDGGLVVVLPETTAQLEELLAGEESAYDSIAAVTASADGTSDPTAPVRVTLNPSVFLGLGPTAGQVVLSHEATHAATGATYRDMPLWLVEGFGDYVALEGEPVPLKVAAGQALDSVREDGPPDVLPTEGDFSTEAHGLGASYEAAWLACRLIAREYGHDDLLRFYRVVARSGDVDAAFERVLGTNEADFTEAWRDYLTELAE